MDNSDGKKKRIYIAYTGGTIGMRRTAAGYAPEAGFLQSQLSRMPELADGAMPSYDIGQYDPLLDSANMTPDDWLRIANDIARRYDDYDGFVVLHGTDTMAYTASALPFMLEGLAKPVILTGSQIPLCEVRNDGRENIITSLLIAANYPIPEVCLYFGTKLLRGCRAVKVNADGFDAFDSPNYPPLARVGIDIVVDWDEVMPAPTTSKPLRVRPMVEPLVGTLRLFPGIPADVVSNMLRPPLRGLVLEAFGVGNGPTRNQPLMDALSAAISRGVVVVNCTQCLRGTVDLDDYAAGSALKELGIISGYDMTAEAALAKLFYLFSEGHTVKAVKELMQQDLRGELTRP